MGECVKLVEQPGGLRLGDWLNDNLDGNWTEFRAAVAFVKQSGVKHIAARLAAFAESRRVQLIAGMDHRGTSYEGLKGLMDAVSPNGRLVIFHNRLPHTFHPKVYLFKSADRAEIVVGSGNLTEGGLYTNYEAGVRVALDRREETDREVLERIEGALDGWADAQSGTSMELNDAHLESLVQAGLVPKEAEMAGVAIDEGGLGSDVLLAASGNDAVHFEAVPVPAAPSGIQPARTPTTGQRRAGRTFVMTLRPTDVGVGQTTTGTSKRSPEIYVPLTARDAEPEFWDWQDGFEEDPRRTGKFDRRGVRMRVGDEVVEVNMMTWPVKHDFRLRSETLRSLGGIGDILVMKKVGGTAFEYDVRVVSNGSTEYQTMLARCDQRVRNSTKRFGYF